MNFRAPFVLSDLLELNERLFSKADRVVPMWDVFKGDRSDRVIGLRHDVDDNPLSFETALAWAEWEAELGYASTYYLLHGAHYWTPETLELAPRFEELGHEVGIHVNALALGLLTGDDPRRILRRALRELRSTGVTVRGCVAHGDNLCHAASFVNDELFEESARPKYGAPDRMLVYGDRALEIRPITREAFGLHYDANWLPRADYLSDSSGRWSQPFETVVARFGAPGQLHLLIHPDWWPSAFAVAVV